MGVGPTVKQALSFHTVWVPSLQFQVSGRLQNWTRRGWCEVELIMSWGFLSICLLCSIVARRGLPVNGSPSILGKELVSPKPVESEWGWRALVKYISEILI